MSLIASGALQSRQEVLIVTLVNAAVDNFRNRIGGFLTEQGLLPGLGYRVRTLHSLAHEIVAQSAGLVGLAAISGRWGLSSPPPQSNYPT